MVVVYICFRFIGDWRGGGGGIPTLVTPLTPLYPSSLINVSFRGTVGWFHAPSDLDHKAEKIRWTSVAQVDATGSYHHHHLIIIYPLTARVVGAPQMISGPVSSNFPCFPLHYGTWRTSGLSIPWCCLPTSSSVCLIFFPLSLYPWKMVLATPDERKAWPYHCSLRLFMIVRRSSCGPIACWILARTSSAKTNLTYSTVNLWQKQNKQNVGVFWGKTSTKQDVRFRFFLRFPPPPPNIKGQTMSGWDGKSDE